MGDDVRAPLCDARNALAAPDRCRQSALRLLDFLKANRSDFESAGFLWRGNESAIKSKEIVLPEWLKEK